MTKNTVNYKAAANWLLGPVKSWLNERDDDVSNFPLPAFSLSELISMVDEGKVSFSVASSKIFPVMIKEKKSATEVAKELNLFQEKDSDALISWVDKVIASMPDKVEEYKKGKKGLIGMFAGEVKKMSAVKRICNR